MKIAPMVDMLCLKSSFADPVYPALIHDEASAILVDTGFPDTVPQLRDALAELGHTFRTLTALLFTHQDIDHIGGSKAILDESPTCAILAHVDEALYLSGERTPCKVAALEAHFDALNEDQRAWHARLKEGFANRRMRVTQPLHDGEVLPACGGIEVIHTPGHTPGHICLYHRPSKTLISGDALNLYDGKLTGPAPQHTADLSQAVASNEKLKRLEIAKIIVYHGGLYQT